MIDEAAARNAAEGALQAFHPYTTGQLFNRVVRVVLRTNTDILFYDASAAIWTNPADADKPWLLVWTNHCGCHAYALADVKHHAIFAHAEFTRVVSSRDEDPIVRMPSFTTCQNCGGSKFDPVTKATCLVCAGP